MLVKELIEQLSKYSPTAEVAFSSLKTDGEVIIDSVSQDSDDECVDLTTHDERGE